jgi:hypothetical protein
MPDEQDRPLLKALWPDDEELLENPLIWKEWVDPYHQLMVRHLLYQYDQHNNPTTLPGYLITKVKTTASWLKQKLETMEPALSDYQMYCSYRLFVEPLRAALSELTDDEGRAEVTEIIEWITARQPNPPLPYTAITNY